MSAPVYNVSDEGTGPVAVSLTVPAGECYELLSVTCKFGVAPTTSEALTITKDADAGANYDVTLYSVDPSAVSATSIVYQPDAEFDLHGGDAVDVAYVNTDGRTWGVEITAKGVF